MRHAVFDKFELRFEAMQVEHLDAVAALEQLAYAHPWQRKHFSDSLVSGYQTQLLMANHLLLGYFVAMKGFEEVHLLNLAVSPGYQKQGLAHIMLDALALWARGHGAHCVWLEVRAGNLRARQVYAANGFRQAGLRRGYYPAEQGQREDAIVMSLPL
jgi:ribosomal-protein-alanine N-acetyltransferase